MSQAVNIQSFHPSWGSSFRRAFLWRSLELIILCFILLYKQRLSSQRAQSQERNHCGGGGAAKKKTLHVQSSVKAIFHSLFSFLLSHKINFTSPSSFWVLTPFHSFRENVSNLPVSNKGLLFCWNSLQLAHSASHVVSRFVPPVGSDPGTDTVVPHSPGNPGAILVSTEARAIGFCLPAIIPGPSPRRLGNLLGVC